MPTNTAEYMKEWRKTDGGQAALRSQRVREKARRRAMQDLIDRHALEYETLLAARLQEQRMIAIDN